jgi:hypothetical protein
MLAMAGLRARMLAAAVICAVTAITSAIAQQATAGSSANPGLRSPRPAEIIQRDPPSSSGAPYIQAVTLRGERAGGHLYIVQEIAYRAAKGNATRLRFQLVSVSKTPLKVTVRDHAIRSASARQQRGTFIAVRFRCGPFEKNYSHVTRATILDADGERSNSVDFTVSCNLATIS